MDYPYSYPIILDDETYIQYGGHTGTSTSYQRDAAYLIAEKKVSAYLNTYLMPTVVTGTYQRGFPQTLDHAHVSEVIQTEYFSDSVLDNYGRLSEYPFTNTYCGTPLSDPGAASSMRVVYQAGLPSGSAHQPDMLLALTILAELNLNEIIDPGANESAGDVGVTHFSNNGYSETRVDFRATLLGSSARANKAAELVRPYWRKNVLVVGR